MASGDSQVKKLKRKERRQKFQRGRETEDDYELSKFSKLDEATILAISDECLEMLPRSYRTNVTQSLLNQ